MHTYGPDARNLAAAAGLVLDPWQADILDMAALKAELLDLGELDEPTEDQISRAETGIPDAFEALDAELAEAEKIDARRSAILSRALDPVDAEPGDGADRRTAGDTRRSRIGAPGIRRSDEQIFGSLDLVEKLVTVDDEDENTRPRSSPDTCSAPAAPTTTGRFASNARRARREDPPRHDDPHRRERRLPRAVHARPDDHPHQRRDQDPIRSMATVTQIATDSWNGVTSAGVSTAWTAEG